MGWFIARKPLLQRADLDGHQSHVLEHTSHELSHHVVARAILNGLLENPRVVTAAVDERLEVPSLVRVLSTRVLGHSDTDRETPVFSGGQVAPPVLVVQFVVGGVFLGAFKANTAFLTRNFGAVIKLMITEIGCEGASGLV